MAQKNLHVFSDRLLRFIDATFPTKTAFAEEAGISPQSLNNSYLKATPFPGSMFFHNLALLGCDLNWLMTGHGLPPDPTVEEMTKWIKYCEAQAEAWKKRRKTEVDALEEILRNIRDDEIDSA
jgi:hypothetical protein